MRKMNTASDTGICSYPKCLQQMQRGAFLRCEGEKKLVAHEGTRGLRGKKEKGREGKEGTEHFVSRTNRGAATQLYMRET